MILSDNTDRHLKTLFRFNLPLYRKNYSSTITRDFIDVITQDKVKILKLSHLKKNMKEIKVYMVYRYVQMINVLGRRVKFGEL